MKNHIPIFILTLFMFGTFMAYAGWRDEIDLEPHGPGGLYSQITTSSSVIHIISRNSGEPLEPLCEDVVYHRSTNTGVEWQVDCIEAKPCNISEHSVDITARGKFVHAVYEFIEQGSPFFTDIKYCRSIDGGQNWETPIYVSEARGKSFYPAITLNNQCVHIVWSDWRHGDDSVEIYYARLPDGHKPQSHWSNCSLNCVQRRTKSCSNSLHPAIAANNFSIHIVWADNRIHDDNNLVDKDNYEIYYNRSHNNGESWVYDGPNGNGLRLTRVAGSVQFPQIAVYCNSVHVVWMDERTETPGIYYLRSTNNGNTWENEIKLFGNGEHPSIAADERGLYVVWEDDYHIYYQESNDWGKTWQPVTEAVDISYKDSWPDITADDLGRHVVFHKISNIRYKQLDIVKPTPPQNLREDPFHEPPPVVILWDANTEPDIKGYAIYRSRLPNDTDEPEWEKIGYTTEISFTDASVEPGHSYLYCVTALDLGDNESSYSNVIEVYVPDPININHRSTPEQTNPGQGINSINYELLLRTLVSVEIYDCCGRMVYQKKQIHNAGLHRIGLNSVNLPAGVYYLIVKTSDAHSTQKFIILR